VHLGLIDGWDTAANYMKTALPLAFALSRAKVPPWNSLACEDD